MDWEYLLDHYCKCPPTTLFHYTTVPGFKGILGTNCIWATDTRYLNDMEEYRHGVSLFQEELKNAADRKKDHIFLKAHPECLDDLLDVETRLDGNFTYCVSFSEEWDLLSQWRAYANTEGLNIGFDYQSLKIIAEKQRFRLMKCLYFEDEKKTLVKKAVDNFLWHYDKSIGDEGVGFFSPSNFGSSLRSMISFFTPFLKHKAFFEEKEWRAVHLYGKIQKEEVSLRKSRDLDIPHAYLILHDVPVNQMYIGPANDMDRIYLQILPLLDSRKLTRVCKRSEIPYRG